LRLPATVRLSSGLHRRSAVQPRLPICCGSRRLPISGSAFQLNLQLSSAARFSSWRPLDLQLAPSTYRPAQPSGRPSTRVSDHPQTRLSINLRLAPPANLQPTFRLTSSSRPRSVFRLRFPANLQLAPSTGPPALAFEPNLRLSSAAASLASPSCQPSACASSQPSGCAFRLASGSRLPPTFQPCPRTVLRLAPLTDSGLRLRANLQLAPSIDPSGPPFALISSLRLQSRFPAPLSS